MSTIEPTDRIVAALRPLIDADEERMLRSLDLLSPQERAVFMLLGHGQRAKEVAWELALSVKTVETHVTRLRAKLRGDGALPDLPQLTFLARLWVRASAADPGV